MAEYDKVESMTKRILAVDWNYDYARRWSHVELFFEYLRRVALWVKANNWTDVHPVMNDIPSKLLPSVRADDDHILLVKNHLEKHGVNIPLTRFCVLALHWAAIEDRSEVISSGLPSPYDPMVIFYERGGLIGKDHAYWVISDRTGSIRDLSFYESRLPLDLDKATLDNIDVTEQNNWDAKYKK